MKGQVLTFTLLKSGVSQAGRGWWFEDLTKTLLLAFAPRAGGQGDPGGCIFLLAAPAALWSQGSEAAGLTGNRADNVFPLSLQAHAGGDVCK